MLFALATLVSLLAWHPADATAAAVGPTAVDDVVHLQADMYPVPRFVVYLANDTLVTRVALTDFPDDQPDGLKPSADHRSVTFPNGSELYMTADRYPNMKLDFEHPGTLVARYRIVDENGNAAEALMTIVVGPGGSASLTIRQGQTTSVDVLVGDIPGNNADGTPGTIDKTSVHFDTRSGGGHVVTVSVDGRTLTDPLRGGVLYASSTTGVVMFEPEDTYRGDRDGYITYVARDTTRTADGTVEHHSYRVSIGIVVITITPRVGPDAGVTVHHASLTLPGVTNDLPGDPSVPLKPELTVFASAGNPVGSTVYDHGRGLKLPGTGWWTIDPAGTITFTPAAGVVGQVRDVYYQITDAAGTTASGAIQVYVAPGPAAKADVASTGKNVDVVVDAPKNDTPGENADLTAGSLDRTSVHFPADGQPSGAVLSRSDRTLSVPGQGVYTADATTGKITFDPASGFTGRAGSVTYSVRDTVRRTDGRVVHNLATSTVTVTVAS